jgi:1-acyl-sn-glycerol-3-phosphate acyltransferase
MIKADHKKWARFVFNIYIDRELKKHFTNFYEANDFPNIGNDTGLILAPNHISWWDGFFIDYVTLKHLERKFHIMMLESQLKKYSFFGKLGAYSIVPENPKSIIETTNYTVSLLKDTRNVVVTYPQGEIEAYEMRPLGIKEGLRIILKRVPVNTYVLPVAFKIHYYNEKNPALAVRYGHLLEGVKIIEDFNVFKEQFYSNLDSLAVSAYNRNFKSDLFLL